jgi:hypothetical protein
VLRSIRGSAVPLPGIAGPALDAVERSMRSASTLHDRATPPTSRRALENREAFDGSPNVPARPLDRARRPSARSLSRLRVRATLRPELARRTIASSFMRVAGAFALCQPSPLANAALRVAPSRPPACVRQAVPTPSDCLLGYVAGSTGAFRHPRSLRMVGGPFERATWTEERYVFLPREGRDRMPPRGAFHVVSPSVSSPFDEGPIAKGVRMSGLSRASRPYDRIRNAEVHGCPRPP